MASVGTWLHGWKEGERIIARRSSFLSLGCIGRRCSKSGGLRLSRSEALVKLCTSVDGFEQHLQSCPELIHTKELWKLAQNPELFLSLAQCCCSRASPKSATPSSVMDFLPPGFVQ